MISEILNEAVQKLHEALETLPRVSTAKLNLDHRAGRVWVDLEGGCIIVGQGNKSTLDYYGGFEYVDEECQYSLGDYTVYTSMDSRVDEALEYYEQEGKNEG